ncbi:SDR family NAD(P)-dependent oxidoreductase [Pseudokineococcus sp. 1T1Z-3]|uniref:SDR family NAD(P)-dependent oxidoreductase n=1 Tax=Pseudokineococcus sp. 1T1Z-3 TaxID=3132745 RepID=UPI00309AFA55
MDLGITGKTALVTGADSGIGWHTARMLLEEGVRVAVSDIDADSLKESASRLPGEVVTVAADLTSLDDVATLKSEVEAGLGGAPDIIVAAAGITGAQGFFHEIDDEGWTKTVEVDLMSPVRTVKAFIDGMRPKGWGRIVLLTSEDAFQPYADEIPYCAAKAGVLALMKGLSKTYASEGILVNSVAPAFISTPMTDAMMQKRADQLDTSTDEAIKSFLAEERPGMELGRRGEPEEVAAAIVFLCSERASFVNGATLRVDSGSVQTI